jgi:D-alanine-D-alanine ligase-like ATP-grasp enzyme
VSRLRHVTILHDGSGTADDVLDALGAAGLAADRLLVEDDLPAMVAGLRRLRPDLVVNLVTRFAGNARLAPDVTAALELLQLPYTGAGPAGLYLMADPNLGQRLLATHGIETAIDADEARGVDTLVALVGNERPEVLLAAPAPASDAEVPAEEVEQRDALVELAKNVAQVLRIRDYGLMVARVTDERRVALVKAIPNPPLARDGDLARAYLRSGDSYEELVRRIVDEAWERSQSERHAPSTMRSG